MKKKLTLSIEPDVIQRVKMVASSKNTTVSSLFEDWGRRVLVNETSEKPLGDELRGNWSNQSDQQVKDPRLEYLTRKHGGENAGTG